MINLVADVKPSERVVIVIDLSGDEPQCLLRKFSHSRLSYIDREHRRGLYSNGRGLLVNFTNAGLIPSCDNPTLSRAHLTFDQHRDSRQACIPTIQRRLIYR